MVANIFLVLLLLLFFFNNRFVVAVDVFIRLVCLCFSAHEIASRKPHRLAWRYTLTPN